MWVSYRVVVQGDDPWFAQWASTYSMWDWVGYRWLSWSSRVVPEMALWFFAPRPIIWWVVATSLCFLIQVFFLYRYFVVSQVALSVDSKGLAFSVASVAPWLMAVTVTDASVFYLTGSINYFWMGAVFLVAYYSPFFAMLNRRLPKQWIYSALSLVAAAIVGISHEQFGMCLVLLSGTALVHYLWTVRKRLAWSGQLGYLLGHFVVATVAFAAAMRAPGNGLRFQAELGARLPDMLTVPFVVRVESDLRWFLDRFINQSGLLLILIWVVLGWLLWRQRRVFAVLTLGAAALLSVLNLLPLNVSGFAVLSRSHFAALGNFHALWGYRGSLASWATVIVWSLLLGLTVVAVALAYPGEPRRAIISVVLLLCSYLALAAIWVSPVTYASGYRVVYVSSLLMVLLLGLLVTKVLERGAGISPDEARQVVGDGSDSSRTATH